MERGSKLKEGTGSEKREKNLRRRTPEQLEALERAYQQSDMPSEEEKRMLAQEIGISEKQVACWFQNKRQRVRRKRVVGDNESLLVEKRVILEENEKKDARILELEHENKELRSTLEKVSRQMDEIRIAAKAMIKEYNREKGVEGGDSYCLTGSPVYSPKDNYQYTQCEVIRPHTLQLKSKGWGESFDLQGYPGVYQE